MIAKPDLAYGPASRKLLERAPLVLTAERLRTYVWCESRSLGCNNEPRLMRVLEARFARYLRRAVPDPSLRANAHADRPDGCKPILQSNDW